MSLVLDVMRKAASFAMSVLILLCIVFLTFNVLAGDPVVRMFPHDGNQELRERIIDEMRLDQPLFVQFIDYIADTLTGDFRVSTGVWPMTDIQDLIWDQVGNTLALLAIALLGSFGLGALLEWFALGGRGRARALLVHGLSLVLVFIPAFSLAMFVIMANVELGLGLPIRGDGTLYPHRGDIDLVSVAESAVLPVLTIILSSVGLAVLVIREGARKAGRDRLGKSSSFRTLADGLVRLRPFAHLHVAWTMAVVLVVDIAFNYGGLGSTMWHALNYFDTPVMMAVSFITPVIVIAASALISLSIHLLSGRPARESLDDWGRGDPVPVNGTPTAFAEGPSSGGWASSVYRSFRSSAMGMAAAIALLALMVVGALAPVLAPVSDPLSYENFEPNSFPDWVNPLPPSFDRSPYTDMLHLLGTDPVGRDVLSVWLLALRDAALLTAVLMAATAIIGMLIGVVTTKTVVLSGLSARLVDFLLTPFARVAVATPLVLLIVARLAALRTTTSSDLLVSGTLTTVFVFYIWAWLLIARPVRAMAKAAGRMAGTDRVLPSLVAESLSVSKFAVPLILATRFSAAAVGLSPANSADFGSMVELSFSYSAYLTGDWHLVVPPLVGMLLICATAFVFLDRAEHVVRTTAQHPSRE